MIKLIVLENDLPTFGPEVRTIEVFRKIIHKDKDRNKATALKEMAFIYFMTDPRSPYVESRRDIDERILKVKKVVGLPNDWTIDAAVEAGLKFYYEELKEDFDIQYLDASITAVAKTKDYLANVNYDLRDVKGVPIYKPADVLKAVKDSGGVMESLKLLREKVLKSDTLNAKRRGGNEISKFATR